MNTSNKSLLQILVEELPKIGGWPDGMNYCGQSAFDNELYFYRHSYIGQPCDKRGIFTDSHRSEYAYTPISRDQYETALAFMRSHEGAKIENLRFEGGELKGEFTPVPPVERIQVNCTLTGGDGWISWSGGECPVDSDAIVEVKYRKSNPYQFNNDRAGDFTWSHHGIDGDIIAYRLQQPHEVKTAGIDVQRDAVKSNDAQLEADLNDCIGQGIQADEKARSALLVDMARAEIDVSIMAAYELADFLIVQGWRKQ